MRDNMDKELKELVNAYKNKFDHYPNEINWL